MLYTYTTNIYIFVICWSNNFYHCFMTVSLCYRNSAFIKIKTLHAYLILCITSQIHIYFIFVWMHIYHINTSMHLYCKCLFTCILCKCYMNTMYLWFVTTYNFALLLLKIFLSYLSIKVCLPEFCPIAFRSN